MSHSRNALAVDNGCAGRGAGGDVAQAGFTQEGLAAAAGLDRGYVGGVENGRRNISLNAMWKLARAIGVTPAAFFATTAEKEPSENVPAAR